MATPTTTAFGGLLRQHRVAAGLTQEALAERAGMSVYGIQKLEAGTTHPYRDTALRLAQALGLTSDLAEQFQAAVAPVRRRGSTRADVPSGERHHNVPSEVTSFVGREQELIDIPTRLHRARLMTLTGVGGSGKTRLAIEVAKRSVDEYPGGVWLVEFAQVTDAALVPHRVAAAVGVRETADRSVSDALADALHNTHLLLVLDNCEHLLDACAALADQLLRECPELRILATSREPIGIPGELGWPVPPLPAPEVDTPRSAAEIEHSAAVRLFVDRAAAVEPRFALSDANASAVAQICRRLDGIPLALVLAAARLDALTPDQLATRLDRRFRLLTGGNRAALPRQQTLGAAIDWSYELLTDVQRRVFERLSVFASGWRLEAAEAICSGDEITAEDVVDGVLQLVRKSLVSRIDDGRYGLLETLREYASDKLRARGPELSATRDRHAAFYSDLVQRVDPSSATQLLPYASSSHTVRDLEILGEIRDNVYVALRWMLDARRATEGLTLIRALVPLWIWHALPADGRHWLEAVLELADREPESVPPALRALTLFFGGVVTYMQADVARSRALLERSVALWRTVDDQVGLAFALANLGDTTARQQEFELAESAVTESLELARGSGYAFAICHALNHVGHLARVRGQPERAITFVGESLVLGRTFDRAGDRGPALSRALVIFGCASAELGHVEVASVALQEALAELRGVAMTGTHLALALDGIAHLAAGTGDSLRAARLFGAADASWRASGATRYPADDQSYARDVQAVKDQLDHHLFEEAVAEGRSMTAAQAMSYALGEAPPLM
jgi:non-specific serine/threonine protein kinase